MKLIVEEHQYDAPLVEKVLDGITKLRGVNGKISVNYVGYYFNPTLDDCVFILPKVLLEDVNGEELVFGKYHPEDLIDLEKQTLLEPVEHDFIYALSVWIYRALVVYRDTTDTHAVLQQQVQQMAKGRIQQCNTFLDILLAIQKFNKENQDFFFFILKNLHSGFNKINWTRTISKSTAIVHNGTPIYIDPVNKKRQINFDEELLIIYFSILNYMHEKYGFPVKINFAFPLITGSRFEQYIKGFGCTRLHQIKYKYFSDKALYLWDLCYAFFDRSKRINIEVNDQEYLLVKSFNNVFEAIIDELVGDKITDKKLLQMKEQPDGKLVDHLYRYYDLTSNEDDKPIYYIGDSKYYKQGNILQGTSIYKQYTYARNVIQWNMDLFNDGTADEQEGQVKLRDDITEGYNITPNFFISAQQNTLDANETIDRVGDKQAIHRSRQFDNRLFDRDTFLLVHYNVNFLFVVALYGRDNSSEKAAWKNKIRGVFRKAIRDELKDKFNFYAMAPKAGTNDREYIQAHFQDILGKVFTPYKNPHIYSLALDSDAQFKIQNDALIEQLREAFEVKPCELGQDPTEVLESSSSALTASQAEKNILTGLIRKSDRDYTIFAEHRATNYNMERIPSINVLDIHYFLPMVAGAIDGFYEVKQVSFKTSASGTPYLHLMLGAFTPLGVTQVPIYKTKMQPGELISQETMVKLYNE